MAPVPLLDRRHQLGEPVAQRIAGAEIVGAQLGVTVREQHRDPVGW